MVTIHFRVKDNSTDLWYYCPDLGSLSIIFFESFLTPFILQISCVLEEFFLLNFYQYILINRVVNNILISEILNTIIWYQLFDFKINIVNFILGMIILQQITGFRHILWNISHQNWNKIKILYIKDNINLLEKHTNSNWMT